MILLHTTWHHCHNVCLNDNVIVIVMVARALVQALMEVAVKELLVCRQSPDQPGHSSTGRTIESAKLGALFVGYGAMAVLAIWM